MGALCVPLSNWLIEAEWRIYAQFNQATVGSDNGLSPEQHQAIIWYNVRIVLNGPLGINYNNIASKI